MSKQLSSVKGVIWLFISKFFPPVISFLVFAYTARILEPADFGFAAFALSFILVASIIQAHGWVSAIVKMEQLDDEDISSIFWLYVLFALLIVACLYVFTTIQLFDFQSDNFNLALRILSIKLVFDAMFQALNALLLRKQLFRLIATRTIASSMVSATSILTLLYFDFGVWALIYSQVILAIGNFIAVLLPTFNHLRCTFSLTKVKKMSGYAWPVTLSEGFLLLTSHIDSMIIGTVLGVKDLGHFNAAKRLNDIISGILIGTVTDVSFPLLAVKQNSNKDLQYAFLDTLFISSVLLFPVFTFLYLQADFLIILVLGDKWQEAVPAFKIFCLIAYCVILGVPQKNIVVIKGMSLWWFHRQLLLAMMFIPLTIYSASYGIKALLLVILCSKVINACLSMYKATQLLHLSFFSYLQVLKASVFACIATAVFLLACESLQSSSSIYTFSLNLVLSVIFYLGCILLFDYLNVKNKVILFFPSTKQLFSWIDLYFIKLFNLSSG